MADDLSTPPEVTGQANPAMLARQAQEGMAAITPQIIALQKKQQESIAEQTRIAQEKSQALAPARQAAIETAQKPMAEYKPEPMPEAPQMGISPDEAKSTLGMVTALAALGGIFTRQPLTAALNNFSAGVQGFVQGNLQAYKQNMEQFKLNIEKAKAHNDDLWRVVQQSNEKNKGDLQARINELAIKAAEYDDKLLLQTLNQKGYAAAVSQLETANKQYSTMLEKAVQFQAAADKANADRLARIEAQKDRMAIAQLAHEDRQAAIAARAPSIKAQAAQQAITSSMNKLDSIISMVQPGVTGARGVANRWWERLAPQVGQPLTGTPANDFETSLGILKGSMYKELVGPGNISRAEWTRIDDILKGLSWHDSAEVTKSSLEQVRRILQENAGLKPVSADILSEAKDLMKQGYAPQQLIDYARGRGYDLKTEDLQ